MRAEKAEAALATAEHCGKDYATERACGECLRCLRTMCEIEAEGNCNRTMEICALQAALATAREQLKQLEARDYFQKCLEDPEMRKKVAAEWMNEENIELRAALATSRALAFEEAARWHDAAAAESERAAEMYEKRGLRVDEQAWIDRATYHFEDAKTLRRMAPFPPSLMAIPREVVEQIRKALEGLKHRDVGGVPCWCLLWPDEEPHCESVTCAGGAPNLVCQGARAALAALEGAVHD